MDTVTRKVPVTVLTGFLGSGKTTLLNRILSENHGKKIAVIENEFGEIGIDNALVVNSEEEIFEMNNGCICCTVRGDLIRILGNLMRRREKFDYILVETTGLADPAPVAQTFFVDDEIQDLLELDGIVTLIDAKHVHLHLGTSSECQEQVAFADVILLNKTDLVSSDELDDLELRIRSMNAMAKIYRTHEAEVAVDKVLDVRGFDLDRVLSAKPDFLQPEYPFEWAGMYKLDRQEGTVSLQEGPDESLDLLLLKVEAPSATVIEQLLNDAARLFALEKKTIRSGESIASPGIVYRLNLSGGGSKSFPLKLESSGNYILFTQHKPEEFALVVNQGASVLQPSASILFTSSHSHDSEVGSVGIESYGDIDSQKFNEWLRALLGAKGADIFRMKGIISVSGERERFVFQGVHMLFDGRPDKPWGEDERLNQLVFIGRNLDRKELVEGFNSCLVTNHQLSLH